MCCSRTQCFIEIAAERQYGAACPMAICRRLHGVLTIYLAVSALHNACPTYMEITNEYGQRRQMFIFFERVEFVINVVLLVKF